MFLLIIIINWFIKTNLKLINIINLWITLKFRKSEKWNQFINCKKFLKLNNFVGNNIKLKK